MIKMNKMMGRKIESIFIICVMIGGILIAGMPLEVRSTTAPPPETPPPETPPSDPTEPCFLAGTRISMADGSHKNIKQVELGDMVKSYSQGEIVTGEVTEVYSHSPDEMPDYYLVINDKLRVTPNHIICVNSKWIPARNITEGDELFGEHNEIVVVTSLGQVQEQAPTYNLEIQGYHTFFVDGILAHNAKDHPEETTHPPTASRNSPSSSTVDAIYGETIDFTVDAYDQDGNLDHVTWGINPPGNHEAIVTHSLSGSSASDTISQTFDEYGTWSIDAKVYDSDGNSDSVDWTITVEQHHPPSASRNSPSWSYNRTDYYAKIDFTVDAYDQDGNLDHVTWYIDPPGNQVTIVTHRLSGSSASDTISVRFDEYGIWSIDAKVYDSDGNSDSVDWTINENMEDDLKPGDIIQLRNDSWTGIDAKWWYNSFYWTHTVLYIGFNETNGKHMVIHSSKWDELDKRYECGIDTLDEIKKEYAPDNCVYLRAKDVSENEINEIISFAKDKIGRPYDMRSIVLPGGDGGDGDWWRDFLEIWGTKQVNVHEEGATTRWGYYCTELVWAAYINETTDPEINLDVNESDVTSWTEEMNWGTLINPWEVYNSEYLDRKYVRDNGKANLPVEWP